MAGIDRASIICRKCGALRHPSNCRHRLKPKAKCGKAIQRALKHQRKSNAKASRTLAKKFVNSKSMLLIHCNLCQHTDQIPGISRTDIFELRRKANICGSARQTPSKCAYLLYACGNYLHSPYIYLRLQD